MNGLLVVGEFDKTALDDIHVLSGLPPVLVIPAIGQHHPVAPAYARLEYLDAADHPSRRQPSFPCAPINERTIDRFGRRRDQARC